MKPLAPVRVLALLLVVSAAATACAASETVTISDAVIESATTTARQNLSSPPEPLATASAPDASTSTDEPADATDDATDDASTSAPTAAGSDDRPSADDEPCVYEGVDSFGDMQIALTFSGTLDQKSDTAVGYEVFAADGDSLVSSSYFVEQLGPGELVRVSVDTVTDEPSGRTGGIGITCEITEVSSFDSDGFAPQPGDSCRFVELDSFDDIQIQIDVASPLSTGADLFISYALQGPDGIRFDSGSTYTDGVISPGEVSSNEVDTFIGFPDWVNESTFTCTVLSIEGF